MCHRLKYDDEIFRENHLHKNNIQQTKPLVLEGCCCVIPFNVPTPPLPSRSVSVTLRMTSSRMLSSLPLFPGRPEGDFRTDFRLRIEPERYTTTKFSAYQLFYVLSYYKEKRTC